MSAGQSLVPKWVEAVIVRVEGWRKSPQMFVQPSWEKSYQRWHFSKLSHWRVWMHIVVFAALVGLVFNFFKLLQVGQSMVDLKSVLFLCAASSTVALVYFFAMQSMMNAISISAKTQGSWDAQPQIMQSVRLLSIAIACELWLRMDGEANTVELALRWVATCPLAFATFEGNCVWFSLVLGLRPFYAASYTGRLADSKADQFLACIAGVGVIIMFFVFRARRAEWIRALATTSVFHSSYIPPTQSVPTQSPLKDGETKMHDDYFTEEEWSGLRAEVEEEGAKMLKRSAHGAGAGRHQGLVPYEWLHGEAVLGRGAYGKVVVVKSSVTGEIRALKRIVPTRRASAAPEGAASAEKRRTEGMVLQMLAHPNVVAFVDELELQGETQLVMELCTGGSLAALIRNFGPIGEDATQWFALNIVHALMYLHQHSISHMDLKPDNCLLAPTPAGDVVLKLCDFGFSGFKQGSRGRVCGTPAYAAPELFSGSRVQSRRKTDIWSLGVCTVAMLTGQLLKLHPPPGPPEPRPPSHASPDASRREAAAHAINEHIRALRALRADPPLPFPLASPPAPHAAFVRACLRLDPAQRPTAHSLARLPFLATTHQCPREDKALATVLQRPPVEWEDIAPVSDYRKMLPRVRRRARSLLSLPGLWQALLDLDPPFHSPDLEDQFREFSIEASVATTHTLWRIVAPVLQFYLIAYDIYGVRTQPLQSPMICFLIAVGQFVIWSPRAFLLRHSGACIHGVRLLLLLHIFTRPISIVILPGRDACLLGIATFLPLVGEALCYLVIVALAQVLRTVVWIVHDNDSSPDPKSAADLFEQVVSVVSVHVVSAAIMCAALVWRRNEERDRFRNECMQREMVAPAIVLEEAASSSKSSSTTKASRSPLGQLVKESTKASRSPLGHLGEESGNTPKED